MRTSLGQVLRRLSGRWRTAFALLPLAPLIGRDHEYRVTGEFRPDGTCTVVVDGKTLFGSKDNQRTWVDDGQFVCGRLAESGVPDVEEFNHVRVMLFKPRGETLKPGRYQIDDEYPRADRKWHGHVAVWDHSLNANPSGLKGALGRYHILAIKGEFELKEIDATRAVGRFDVRARKKWSVS